QFVNKREKGGEYEGIRKSRELVESRRFRMRRENGPLESFLPWVMSGTRMEARVDQLEKDIAEIPAMKNQIIDLTTTIASIAQQPGAD
ncbi:unnamed protein product, partial [Dovyalis caffra]